MRIAVAVAISLLFAGCSSGATDDQSGEAAISNQALAIEKAADDEVAETINQIETQSVAENPVEAQAEQDIE